MIDLTVNILEKFIAGLNISGDILSLNRSSEQTVVNVEKTYQARKEMFLDVDGVNYKILEVKKDQSITVEGVIKTGSTYKIPNPKYFHGTPLMTNAQINGVKISTDKLPMIYLYEILRERELPVSSQIVRESDLRLFFLDTANFSDWSTDDHYSKRLVGLNCLVDFFIEEARKNTCQFYLYKTKFTRINHVKWGVFQDNKGHITKLFDDELTGVELSFTLPLRQCNK